MTIVSAEAKAAYAALNALWPKPLPALTGDEAKAAALKLYREFMGKAFIGPVRITSGNRYTWVTNGTLIVNPDKGWETTVHLLSHYIHGKRSKTRPHSAEHAKLELRMVKHAVSNGWLEGALKPKAKAPQPAKPPVNLRAVKIASIEAGIKRWMTKARRAETALKKLKRQQAYYARMVA